MKIYTKTGDAGETSLYTGERINKDTPRVGAYGAVDEANSALAMARKFPPSNKKFMTCKKFFRN